ncbi:MAG: cyclic nucleotide-binding domain-containing protein [Pseudomonadota bacterium]
MPDLFDRLILLKQSPIFSMVMTDDLRVVAQAMEKQQYFAGDRIFETGDQGDHLYIIISGKVGISLESKSSGTSCLATLSSGDCFGEMNLLDDLPRSATAEVIEDTTLLSLEKTRLRGLIQSYPDMSVGMLRSLSLRLRDANRKLMEDNSHA